jgi:multidrug resistance efflux pump
MNTEEPKASEEPQPKTSSVAMLDQALWSKFDPQDDLQEFTKTWLALLIRGQGNVAGAAVVLRADTVDNYAPIAIWPKDSVPAASLSEAIDVTIERASEAVVGDIAVGCPLMLDGELIGAVGLIFQNPGEASVERSRSVYWGTGWLVAAIRKDMMAGAARERSKVSSILELTGAVLDANGFKTACLAAANHLVRQLGCEQVALGFLQNNQLTIASISDVAEIRLNTNQMELIERTMTEATDQEGTILFPERSGQDFMVNMGHETLSKSLGGGDVMTVPLFARNQVVGALQLQKPAGERLADGEIMVGEAAAATLGPMLYDQKLLDRNSLAILKANFKTQNVRMFGPDYPGRKLVASVLVFLILFLSIVHGDFQVSAQAELQGQVVRSIVAPFDGHIDAQFAREGDILESGDKIAMLDVRDLNIELLRWSTDVGRYQSEYNKALEQRDASAASIARANMEQSSAKTELVRRQLDRATLKVPFDAIVISGDLSQSLGSAVHRGDELFRIAPLKQYRVELEVDESEFDEVQIGQTGKLILSSLPNEQFDIEVVQITPKMESRDGRNFAYVESRVIGPVDKVRPGMRGIAKVYIERRPLIQILTQPMLDWLRLALWRWTP